MLILILGVLHHLLTLKGIGNSKCNGMKSVKLGDLFLQNPWLFILLGCIRTW